MKETLSHTKDEVQAVAEVPVESQHIFQGNQRLRPGHKCWKIDGKTLDVAEAEYETIAVRFEDAAAGMSSPKRKVIMEKGYWYVTALNKRNAIRRLHVMISQMQQAAEREANNNANDHEGE
jgi:hypothetical protein